MIEDPSSEDYFQFKAKNKKHSSKFSTGHTFRNFKLRDVLLHNTGAFVCEDLRGEPNKLLQDLNITFYDQRNTKIVNQNKPNESILFSLNKKKRWLMNDLLREAAQNDLKYSKSTETQETASNGKKYPETKFKIMSYSFGDDLGLYHSHNKSRFFGFFDNNGKEFHDVKFDANWFDKKLYNQETRRRKTKLEKPRKKLNKRVVFKYGNRDRNSGIKKRSGRILQEQVESVVDTFYNNINVRYCFLVPTKNYANTKVWVSGLEKMTHQFNGSEYRDEWKRYRAGRQIWNLNQYKYNRFTFNHLKKDKEEILAVLKEKSEALVSSMNENENDDLSIRVKFNLDECLEKRNSFGLDCRSNLIKRTHIELEQPARNMILIDESEIICFDGRKKSEIEQTREELVHEKTPNPTFVDTSFTSMFKKLTFNVQNEISFLQSVNSFVNLYHQTSVVSINFDVCPIQIQVDLKSLIPCFKSLPNSTLSAWAIYDIQSFNSVLVNFYCEKKVEVSLNFDSTQFEAFSALIEHIRSKIEVSLSNFEVLENKMDVFKPTNTHKSNIFSHVSSVNHSDLIKVFEKHLKMTNNTNYFNQNDLKASFNAHGDVSKIIKTCEICYDDLEWPSNFFKLNKCGHEACVNCWRNYLTTRIVNFKVTTSFSKGTDSSSVKQICCLLDKCDELVRLDLFYGLVEADLVNKYVQFYTDLKLMRNRSDFVYCVDQKCRKIILVNDSIDKNEMLLKSDESFDAAKTQMFDFVKTCECGYKICKFCTSAFHFPSMCRQAKMYFKDLKKFEELQIDSGVLYTSEGKRCPSCDNYMEKNAGCNHMSCPCGFQFCWLCLKEFYSNHSASDGFFCKHPKIEETKYDSYTFVNFSKHLKNIRTDFYKIITEQRRFHSSAHSNYLIKRGVTRLRNQASASVCKAMNKAQMSEKYAQNRLFSKLEIDINTLRREIKTLSRAQQMMQLIQEKIDLFAYQVEDNFRLLNLTIQYLALLMSSPGKVFKVSEYSFKPNLLQSLHKGLHLKGIVQELFLDHTGVNFDTCVYFDRLVFYNDEMFRFVSNIKHLVVDCLRIYEKYPVNFEDAEGETSSGDAVVNDNLISN
jgi:hypothetical protein